MTHCPSLRELEELFSGELPAGARHMLNVHLEKCDGCREELDRLSDEPELRQWARPAPATDVDESDGPGLARLLEIGARWARNRP